MTEDGSGGFLIVRTFSVQLRHHFRPVPCSSCFYLFSSVHTARFNCCTSMVIVVKHVFCSASVSNHQQCMVNIAIFISGSLYNNLG